MAALVRAMVSVILVLAVPWMLVGILSAAGLASNDHAVAFLSGGGRRGRTIDGILYAVPTIAAGFVAAKLLSRRPFPHLFACLALATALALFSATALRAAAADRPVRLLPSQGFGIGRAAQALFFVGVGSIFGGIGSELRQDRARERRRGHGHNALPPANSAP